MGILDFLSKQFVDVIDRVEEPGQLGWRVPLADRRAISIQPADLRRGLHGARSRSRRADRYSVCSAEDGSNVLNV